MGEGKGAKVAGVGKGAFMEASSATDIATFTLLVAGLLTLVAAIQPLSARLRLPPSVLLALVGIGLGFLGIFLLNVPLSDVLEDIVRPIVNLPVSSQVFLYVFLPVLLFEACITLEVRRIIEDIVPILVLAVLAVVITAAAIGFSLEAVFSIPLTAALLFGAIVATTDPAAVVAIFRDIGAPARLTRLIQGESLLNDAAAIALFSLLLAVVVSGEPIRAVDAVERFTISFFGGALAGYVAGRIVVSAIRFMGGLATAEVTLTVAAAYLIYIVCDLYFGVSGVVAVVVAGLIVGIEMPARIAPENWRHMRVVWEQIAFWASSLVFLLAAILVPRFLDDASLGDLAVVLAAFVAAHLARTLVLFVVLPFLEGARAAQNVSLPYRVTILWGGLRGAVTLALALAVTENAALSPELKRFVGVTATGFVLLTLFVNGLTLERLIRLLKLDELSPVDRALRNQVLSLALTDVGERVQRTASRYDIGSDVLSDVVRGYGDQATAARTREIEQSLTERERLTLGLIALAAQEKELILQHHGQRTIAPHCVGPMLRHAERIIEQTRSDGRTGYNRAARGVLAFGIGLRAAYLAHHFLGVDGFLRDRLALRFEKLVVMRLVLLELLQFVPSRITPLLGSRIAELLIEMLERRHGAVRRALDALRLQYPGYAEALERNFLMQIGEQQELNHYAELRAEGLLGREVYENLRSSAFHRRPGSPQDARLDMKLDAETMIRSLPLFAHLNESQVRSLSRLTRGRFVLPEKVIVRQGETRHLSLYFIASGAVEVRRPGDAVQLGPGEFFGEMALLTSQPRSFDVVSLNFCHLLTLSEHHFRRFLKEHPELRDKIEEIAEQRVRDNMTFEVGRTGLVPASPA